MTAPIGARERHLQAKRPRSGLAGPYGHPIHPAIVAIPIGAWVSALVFDIVSWTSARYVDAFLVGAFWLLVIGIVGALVAAVFGFMDLLTIPRGTRAFRTAITHMTLNLVVVALFLVNVGVRSGGGIDSRTMAGVVMTIVGLVVLSVSGWLGGKLAYHFGVRVADEATQRSGF